MKRSDMSKGMVVRFRDDTDNDSFWSKMFVSRYLVVEIVDKQPDDSTWWGMSYGALMFYKLNYMKQFSNSDVNAISEEEAERFNIVLKDRANYADLHKLSREIVRGIEQVESLLEDLDISRDADIWEVSDKEHFRETIWEAISCNGEYSSMDENDKEEVNDDVSDAVELFGKLCYNLDELTKLEDKYIRGGK